jgi:GT2 family glycosyltransferase
VVGFHLRNTDGSVQLSAGMFPSLASTLARRLLPRSRRKYRQAVAGGLQQVPWVTGCCWLLRRDCIDALGGFDEDFFLYYEDVDFCRRARAEGWSVWYEPGIRATHHLPLHTRHLSPGLRVVTRHALLTYAAKHWARWQFHFLTGLVRAEAWFKGRWAQWHGEKETTFLFQEMGAIALELGGGRSFMARLRLERLLRRQERRGAS